jgi:tetratricopeptide (TPR) repeat protein
MLHSMPVRLFLVAGLVLLAACARQPGKPLAARQVEAIEANRRAELRFRRGDFDGAVQQYQEALRIAQSVEDIDGIAANAINLSIAYQRLGKNAEARASLAPVLEHSGLSFPSARLAQAALRRALLDSDRQRHAPAAEWLEKAATWCGQQGCTLSAAIDNVRGLLALEAGLTDAAAASATAALKASRASGDRVETANALRLLGNVAIRAGDAAAALAALTEALALDQELALPRKIYLDLVSLGRASAQGGERARARSYYERALAVSQADRDAGAAAEARALIGALGSVP